MSGRRWNRIPPELAGRVRALAAQGKTQREIVEMTGVTKGSMWRALRPRPSTLPAVWTPRDGALTLCERVEIAVGLRQGETFTVIGRRIGRDVSTISREVGGRLGRDGYDPDRAHRHARGRTLRPKVCKLAANT